MEPRTEREPLVFTAVMAALIARVTVAEDTLLEAYQELKATLKRKFEEDSDVIEAVNLLERNPYSVARQGLLMEETEKASVDQDREVFRAARNLVELLSAKPGGKEIMQNALDSYKATALRHHRELRQVVDEYTHAAILSSLAWLLWAQGDLQEASCLYERALEIRRRTLGEEHPETVATISKLGSLLRNRGNYDEARSFYERALEIRRRTLGEEHPDTAATLNNLALPLQAQDEYDEAPPLRAGVGYLREDARKGPSLY